MSDVTSGKDGYSILLTGFGAYKNALTVHTSYRQTVTSAIIDVALSTPLVILFSFFILLFSMFFTVFLSYGNGCVQNDKDNKNIQVV